MKRVLRSLLRILAYIFSIDTFPDAAYIVVARGGTRPDLVLVHSPIYARCVKWPSTECRKSSLSLSRATVQPSPVYISDKTRIYHPPSPLSSRLISARFRSKAICGSGGREGGGEVDGVWPPGGSWTIIGESGWIEISRSSDDLRYVPWNF